jgi:hypothetical protein
MKNFCNPKNKFSLCMPNFKDHPLFSLDGAIKIRKNVVGGWASRIQVLIHLAFEDGYTANEGRWDSNINVWFPFMYSQNETVQPPYFQNRIIMFWLPIPTLMYCICERFIYFQDQSVYFAAAHICGPIMGIYKSLTTHECGNWDWGRAIPRKGIHKWDFHCSVMHSRRYSIKMFTVTYLRVRLVQFRVPNNLCSRVLFEFFIVK